MLSTSRRLAASVSKAPLKLEEASAQLLPPIACVSQSWRLTEQSRTLTGYLLAWFSACTEGYFVCIANSQMKCGILATLMSSPVSISRAHTRSHSPAERSFSSMS